MKKTLIIAGIFILLGLSVVLISLLSDKDGGGIFASFGFGDTTDNTLVVDVIENVADSEIFDVFASGPLYQLTTKPVIGYGIVQKTPSSTPEIYYVEAGTGHVYSISTDSYTEKRISNTTIAQVKNAVISDDGSHVVLLGEKITILTLPSTSDGSVSSFVIPEKAEDVTIVDGELLFVTKTQNGALVKNYTLGSKLSAGTLFSIPLREISLAWGNDIEGPHYFYPKPANELEGYVYSYSNGSIVREPISGFGLSAVNVGTSIIYSTSDDEHLLKSYDPISKQHTDYYIRTMANRCVKTSKNQAVCAVPENYSKEDGKKFLIGDQLLTDSFRVITPEEASVGPTKRLAGDLDLSISVLNIKAREENYILFTNKSTGNLWLYYE